MDIEDLKPEYRETGLLAVFLSGLSSACSILIATARTGVSRSWRAIDNASTLAILANADSHSSRLN
jgi:hypothetical protein